MDIPELVSGSAPLRPCIPKNLGFQHGKSVSRMASHAKKRTTIFLPHHHLRSFRIILFAVSGSHSAPSPNIHIHLATLVVNRFVVRSLVELLIGTCTARDHHQQRNARYYYTVKCCVSHLSISFGSSFLSPAACFCGSFKWRRRKVSRVVAFSSARRD